MWRNWPVSSCDCSRRGGGCKVCLLPKGLPGHRCNMDDPTGQFDCLRLMVGFGGSQLLHETQADNTQPEREPFLNFNSILVIMDRSVEDSDLAN